MKAEIIDKNLDFEKKYFYVLNYFFLNKKLETENRKFFELLQNQNETAFCSTPWTVSWQINSNCNLRCKHCFFAGIQDSYEQNNDLDNVLSKKIAQELIDEYSVVAVSITGGEPLLRNDLFDVIKIFKKNHVIVSLQTNGTLITKQIAQNLKFLLNKNCDYVQISLDGSDSISHDKIRGNGSFEKACRGIKLLIDAGIKVNVNCTPQKYNSKDLPKIYSLCSNLGVTKFSVSRFVPYCEDQFNLVPDFSQLINAFYEIIIKRQDSDTFFELNYKFFDFVSSHDLRLLADKYLLKNPKSKDISQNLICHKNNTLYISPDGKLYLCFASVSKNGELGDYKKNSLRDIWNNHNKNIFYTPRFAKNMICKSCKYFYICKGGCMASAFQKYQDKNYPDGLCLYAKELFKI